MKYDSSNIKFIDASRKPDWASKPIPTIWASQQREIQELRKRLDSLVKAMRDERTPPMTLTFDLDYAMPGIIDTGYYPICCISNPGRGIGPVSMAPCEPHEGNLPRTFTDSATQSRISISPDGLTSVTSLPKKKSKRRGKPSTSKPPAKL